MQQIRPLVVQTVKMESISPAKARYIVYFVQQEDMARALDSLPWKQTVQSVWRALSAIHWVHLQIPTVKIVQLESMG